MTEREAFEKWLGIKPSGQAHYLAWQAWQAARASEKPPTHADLRCDCGAVWRWKNRKWSMLATSPKTCRSAQPCNPAEDGVCESLECCSKQVQTNAAGLMTEQASLLRECRAALDSLIQQKPTLAGMLCGSTTIGNLRASLHEYRPHGGVGGSSQQSASADDTEGDEA